MRSKKKNDDIRTYCVEATVARNYFDFNARLKAIATRCINAGIHLGNISCRVCLLY
jgi:hypothetical protein